jgi:hypothetical protein
VVGIRSRLNNPSCYLEMPTIVSWLACLEKVLHLSGRVTRPVGKEATFVGEASPTKLAPQERTCRKPSGNPRSASRKSWTLHYEQRLETAEVIGSNLG